MLSVLFLVTAVLFVWSFRLGTVLVAIIYMILLGFVSNLIPASMFTLAPETVSEVRHAGLALALVITGSQIGSLTGPPALGSVVSGGSWTAGSWVLAAVMAAGVVFLLAGWRRVVAEGRNENLSAS
jgi:MFS family permease